MKKYKKNKLSLLLLTIAALLLVPSGGLVTKAYASDQPVKEETEPAGADHGEVRMQAIRYRAFTHPIQLEFYPEFEGGIHYSFILNEENNFELEEELVVGTYRVTAGIATERDMTNIDVRATVTPRVEIEEAPESVPVVVALEATGEFIEDYSWLTDYCDDVDGHLSGPISKDEADAYYEKDIATQHSDADFTNTDGEIDYSVTTVDSEETEQTETAQFEPEEEQRESTGYLKYIIPGIVVVIVIFAGVVLIKKKKSE